MTEQQAKEAIGRIDRVLTERRIEPALTRIEHVQLAQDVQAIQERVKFSYVIEAEALEQLTAKKVGPTIVPIDKEIKDGRTD